MFKIQKTFQMIALTALMIVLNQSSVCAKKTPPGCKTDCQMHCRAHCEEKHPDSLYVKCKKDRKCGEELTLSENPCKQECMHEFPDEAYNACNDDCKKAYVAEHKTSSKKEKHSKK